MSMRVHGFSSSVEIWRVAEADIDSYSAERGYLGAVSPPPQMEVPEARPRANLERETRFELATLSLATRCSTTELFPRLFCLYLESDELSRASVYRRGSHNALPP